MTARADSRATAGAPANRYLAQLRTAKRGPQIAALFDFDGTIIAGYSATGVLREKFTRGQMSAEEVVGTAAAMTRYWRGRIGFSGLMTAGAKLMQGVSEQSFAQLGEDLRDSHQFVSSAIHAESPSVSVSGTAGRREVAGA